MDALYSVTIDSNYGSKTIAVFSGDILLFDQPIDILTTSAYFRSYAPTPKTLFEALLEANIMVEALAKDPVFDLRSPCNVWLSKPIQSEKTHIKRIGCIEMVHSAYNPTGSFALGVNEQEMLKSVKAYFQMLDMATTYGIKMDTVALPVLGSGRQKISEDLILIPLINECLEFLKRNSAVKQIYFIERATQKAVRVAQVLANSYAIHSEQHRTGNGSPLQMRQDPIAFISYSSKDRNIADNLCVKLESKGIKVWYAPRNVTGDYATAIAEAIRKATHFVIILSRNSMMSEHVLNEIDLAFKKLPKNIKFEPLRIDDQEFAPAFDYYLSRQHWMDAYIPPIEDRLHEFVDRLADTL